MEKMWYNSYGKSGAEHFCLKTNKFEGARQL